MCDEGGRRGGGGPLRIGMHMQVALEPFVQSHAAQEGPFQTSSSIDGVLEEKLNLCWLANRRWRAKGWRKM